MSTRIKTAYADNEQLAPNFAKDAAWISKNRLKLYEMYGSSVILVYHEEVIGYGSNLKQAVELAETQFGESDKTITPVIKRLSSPYRIGVLRHKKEAP